MVHVVGGGSIVLRYTSCGASSVAVFFSQSRCTSAGLLILRIDILRGMCSGAPVCIRRKGELGGVSGVFAAIDFSRGDRAVGVMEVLLGVLAVLDVLVVED